MSRATTWLVVGVALLATADHVAMADELKLLDTPVKVTAAFDELDDGSYAAQIGVHKGPIVHLVHTVLRAPSRSSMSSLLRQQVSWHAPYLFVHSSCGGGRSLRCEGEALFKVVDGTATRLGDLVGNTSAMQSPGHFLDVYDKLDGRIDAGLDSTPSFLIALDDVNGKLRVNAGTTWSSNAAAWRMQADMMASTQPGGGETNSQYLTALISNAALARYCNKAEELEALLSVERLTLTAEQMRLVTDAISKVVPLELPREWRKLY